MTSSDFLEPSFALVPDVVHNDVLFAELLLGLTIDKLKNGVKISAHVRIKSAQRLNRFLVQDLSFTAHALWHIETARLEREVHFLKALAERLLHRWHTVSNRRVVIVDA